MGVAWQKCTCWQLLLREGCCSPEAHFRIMIGVIRKMTLLWLYLGVFISLRDILVYPALHLFVMRGGHLSSSPKVYSVRYHSHNSSALYGPTNKAFKQSFTLERETPGIYSSKQLRLGGIQNELYKSEFSLRNTK